MIRDFFMTFLMIFYIFMNWIFCQKKRIFIYSRCICRRSRNILFSSSENNRRQWWYIQYAICMHKKSFLLQKFVGFIVIISLLMDILLAQFTQNFIFYYNRKMIKIFMKGRSSILNTLCSNITFRFMHKDHFQ